MNRYSELKKKLEASVTSSDAIVGEGTTGSNIAESLSEFGNVISHSNAVLSAVGHDLNILIPLINKFVFSTDSKIRQSAIPVFTKLQGCLSENIQLKKMAWWKEYKTSLEKNCDKLAVIKNSGSDEWSTIWCILVRMLGEDIHSSLALTNALLRILEKAFKNKSSTQDKERQTGFHCWRTMVDGFAQAKEPLSKRRMEFLLIPLKAPNHSSKVVCEAKLQTWMHVVTKMAIKDEACVDIFIPPLLDFLYVGSKVLPPAWKLISANRCASEFMAILRIQTVFKRQAPLLIKMSANCMETVKDDSQLSQLVWCNVLDALRKLVEGTAGEKPEEDQAISEFVSVIDKLSASFRSTEFAKLILTCSQGKSKLSQLKIKFPMLVDIIFKPKLLIKLNTEAHNVIHALLGLYMPKERTENVFTAVLDSIQESATNLENNEETADVLNKLSEAWTAIVESLVESAQWIFCSDNYRLAHSCLLLPLKYLVTKNGWCNGPLPCRNGKEHWRNLLNTCYKVAEANKQGTSFINELIKQISTLNSVSYSTCLEVMNIVIDTCETCDALPYYAGVVDDLLKQHSDSNHATFITSLFDSMIKHVKKNNLDAAKIVETASRLGNLKNEALNSAIKKYIIKLQNSISTMNEITPKKNSKFLHRLAKAKEIQFQSNNRSPSTSPISVFHLNSAEKKRGSPSVKTPIKTLEEDSSQDFVMVPPKPRKTPLTEHQKERFSKRRCDIPALYQDLSQDTQTIDSLLNVDAFERAKEKLGSTHPEEDNVGCKSKLTNETGLDNSIAFSNKNKDIDISLRLDYTVANMTTVNNNNENKVKNMDETINNGSHISKEDGQKVKPLVSSEIHTADGDSITEKKSKEDSESTPQNGTINNSTPHLKDQSKSNSEKSVTKSRRKADTPVRKSLRKTKLSPLKLLRKRTISASDCLSKGITKTVSKKNSLTKKEKLKTRKPIAGLDCNLDKFGNSFSVSTSKDCAEDGGSKECKTSNPSKPLFQGNESAEVQTAIVNESHSKKAKGRKTPQKTKEEQKMAVANKNSAGVENIKTKQKRKQSISIAANHPVIGLDDAVSMDLFEKHFEENKMKITPSVENKETVPQETAEKMLPEDEENFLGSEKPVPSKKQKKSINDSKCTSESESTKTVTLKSFEVKEDCKSVQVNGSANINKEKTDKMGTLNLNGNVEGKLDVKIGVEKLNPIQDLKKTVTPQRKLRLTSRNSSKKKSPCLCCDGAKPEKIRHGLSRALFDADNGSLKKNKRKSEHLDSDLDQAENGIIDEDRKQPVHKKIKTSTNDASEEDSASNAKDKTIESSFTKSMSDEDYCDIVNVHISKEEVIALESFAVETRKNEEDATSCDLVNPISTDETSKEESKHTVSSHIKCEDTEDMVLDQSSTAVVSQDIIKSEEDFMKMEVSEEKMKHEFQHLVDSLDSPAIKSAQTKSVIHQSTKESFTENISKATCAIKSVQPKTELPHLTGESLTENKSNPTTEILDAKLNEEIEISRTKQASVMSSLDSWVIRPSKQSQIKIEVQKSSSADEKCANVSESPLKSISVSDSDDSYVDSSQEPTDSIIKPNCFKLHSSETCDLEDGGIKNIDIIDSDTEVIILDTPCNKIVTSNEHPSTFGEKDKIGERFIATEIIGKKDKISEKLDAREIIGKKDNISEKLEATKIIDKKDKISEKLEATEMIGKKDKISETLEATEIIIKKDEISEKLEATEIIIKNDKINEKLEATEINFAHCEENNENIAVNNIDNAIAKQNTVDTLETPTRPNSSSNFINSASAEKSKSCIDIENNTTDMLCEKSQKLSVCRRLVDDLIDKENLEEEASEQISCTNIEDMDKETGVSNFSNLITHDLTENKVSGNVDCEEIVYNSEKCESPIQKIDAITNLESKINTVSENLDSKNVNEAVDIAISSEKRSPLKKSRVHGSRQKPECKVSSPSRASRIKHLVSSSISPEKTCQIEAPEVLTIIEDSQTVNSSPQSARGRTAHLMELVNGDSATRIRKHQPTPKRLRPIRLINTGEVETDEGENWIRKTYSPLAVPSPGILKTRSSDDISPQSSPGIMKRSSEDTPQSDISPPAKKKRVNFHDPPLTKKLFFDKLECGRGKVVTQGKSADTSEILQRTLEDILSVTNSSLENILFSRRKPLEQEAINPTEVASTIKTPERASAPSCSLSADVETQYTPTILRNKELKSQSDISVNTDIELLTRGSFTKDLLKNIDKKSKVDCIVDLVSGDKDLLSRVFNKLSEDTKFTTIKNALKDDKRLISKIVRESTVKECISKDACLVNEMYKGMSMETRVGFVLEDIERNPSLIKDIHKNIRTEDIADTIASEISDSSQLAQCILDKTDIKTVATLMKFGSEIILKSYSSE